MPLSEVLQTGRSCLSVEQVVAEYAVEIVIDEQRSIPEEKRRTRQHAVDRLQEFRKLSAQIPSVGGPFSDASSSEFPLLVANEHRPFDEGAGWNHIRIVHFETYRFQIILNIA